MRFPSASIPAWIQDSEIAPLPRLEREVENTIHRDRGDGQRGKWKWEVARKCCESSYCAVKVHAIFYDSI